MNAINLLPKNAKTTLKRGMTLVELLTVLFLGSLVISMTFVLYTNTSRSILRQDVIMSQLLNLRAGLASISRDIRGLGNGFSLLGLGQGQMVQMYTKDENGDAVSWFRYPTAGGVAPPFGVAPIYAVDGGKDGADSLYVASLAPDFLSPLGQLEADLTPGDSQLSLTNILDVPSGLEIRDLVKKDDYLAIVPSSGDPVLVEASNDPASLAVIPIKSLPEGGFPNEVSRLPEGSVVYNVKSVVFHSYSIDTLATEKETFLTMNTLESQDDIMAEGIEDLQVAYCFGNDNPADINNYDLNFSGLNTTPNPIKTIRLIMVARSTLADPNGNTFDHILKLNRETAGPADPYPRRFLETSVQLRNY
jgi:prepilin-type N-terminal cleavage/methylation domain-containing protein